METKEGSEINHGKHHKPKFGDFDGEDSRQYESIKERVELFYRLHNGSVSAWGEAEFEGVARRVFRPVCHGSKQSLDIAEAFEKGSGDAAGGLRPRAHTAIGSRGTERGAGACGG